MLMAAVSRHTHRNTNAWEFENEIIEYADSVLRWYTKNINVSLTFISCFFSFVRLRSSLYRRFYECYFQEILSETHSEYRYKAFKIIF